MFAPEPMGIAPLSTVWALAMQARGHEVTVVTAHPHYPEPIWPRRARPTRENLGGVRVLRLPSIPGRRSARERIVHELSLVGGLTAAMPVLPPADVIVSVSPSFGALAPAMLAARLRRIPWVLWLQDILPDGALATNVLPEGGLIEAARRFESFAYSEAARIVVIADSFADNLRAKGVPDTKMVRIYNPASMPVVPSPRERAPRDGPPVVMTMGNIGLSQNLAHTVRAFEQSPELAELDARLVIVGDGVQVGEVRAAISTDRVELTGVECERQLAERLAQVDLGLISQDYAGRDFNVPLEAHELHGLGCSDARRGSPGFRGRPDRQSSPGRVGDAKR